VPTSQPYKLHVLAVVAFILAYGVVSNAAAYFKSWVPADTIGFPTAVGKFCKRNFLKFVETGSVHPAPRSGRPPAIDKKEAQHAADLVKKGYTIWAWPNNQPVELHRFFTSIKQACHMVPELHALLHKHSWTPHQLLQQLRKVDPSLKFLRLHTKMPLTEKQMKARRKFAKKELKKISRDPQYLDGKCYADVATIIFTSEKHANVRVWADAADAEVHAVLAVPNIKQGHTIKVSFLAVVNPVIGPAFIEMVTGTKDIDRWYNQRGDVYYVSGSLPCKPNAAIALTGAREGGAAQAQAVLQHISIPHPLPSLPSVHMPSCTCAGMRQAYEAPTGPG
jgi:hypothetical protein